MCSLNIGELDAVIVRQGFHAIIQMKKIEGHRILSFASKRYA
jgi:hypothetical protein